MERGTRDQGQGLRDVVARAMAGVEVREADCGTIDGLPLGADEAARDGDAASVPHSDGLAGPTPELRRRRWVGRRLVDDAVEDSGDIIARRGEVVTEVLAELLHDVVRGGATVTVRSVLTCQTEGGVCQACLGATDARGVVALGTRVGLAATELVPQVFEASGPRYEALQRLKALLEAWTPKGRAVIAPCDGWLKACPAGPQRRALFVVPDGAEHLRDLAPDARGRVTSERGAPFTELASRAGVYPVELSAAADAVLRARDGDAVRAGDALTDGPVSPHDVLSVLGERACALWLLRELRRAVPALEAGEHTVTAELVVRAMLSLVTVTDPRGTGLATGQPLSRHGFARANAAVARRWAERCVVDPACSERLRSVSRRVLEAPPDRAYDAYGAEIAALEGDYRSGPQAELWSELGEMYASFAIAEPALVGVSALAKRASGRA